MKQKTKQGTNNMNSKMSAPTGKMVRMGDGAYITVFMNGESLTLKESESPESFANALVALKNQDWGALYQAMRPVKSFALKVAGVEVNSSGVSWNGKPLHNAIAKRIMDFGLAGLDHKPLCNFLAKLMKNPSSRAVNELYTFLEHQNLPITDNGNFLAYKGIQNDWYSCTAGDAVLLQGKVKDGKIWNAIGEVIEVERNYVDDDKDRGCSKGLHAGTMEYATGFGPRTVIVEIDPKDVVSIPSDCSCQKLRTCQYKVVDEFVAALTNPVYDSRWNEPDDFADESDESTQSDWGDPDEWGYSDEWFVTEDSNWIESVHYWHEGSRMALLKLDGGSIGYENVPSGVYDDFAACVENGGSAGSYYNDNIKGVYTQV
jgi:hypothetical protein